MEMVCVWERKRSRQSHQTCSQGLKLWMHRRTDSDPTTKKRNSSHTKMTSQVGRVVSGSRRNRHHRRTTMAGASRRLRKWKQRVAKIDHRATNLGRVCVIWTKMEEVGK